MTIPNTPYLKIDWSKYTHRTRSGHPARILCTDFACPERPVVAAVRSIYASESLVLLRANLKEKDDTNSERDLFERSPWDDVAVDTPIWVCNHKGRPSQWAPRHFAKYENGMVFAWMHGTTSHTGDDKHLIEWEHATLENPNEPPFKHGV